MMAHVGEDVEARRPRPASPGLGPSDYAALDIRNVSKSYGTHPALVDVTLSINPGEVVALLGPNGAGKTTLVSIIAGLRRPDQGTVGVAGCDVQRDPGGAREQLGLVPQDLAIYPNITVRESLFFFGRMNDVRGKRLVTTCDDVADALGLSDLLDRQAGLLSGGEKRRLHTAAALLHEPRVLLLDEPSVGADVLTRQRIIDVVRSFADRGTAICFSTHYLAEVEAAADRIAIIDRGRIVAQDDLETLLAKHGDGSVEITFDGTPPDLHGFEVERTATSLRVVCDRPMEVVDALGAGRERITSMRVTRPSLEQIFLELTSRDPVLECEETDAP